MSPLPLALGALLGAGCLLVWRGLTRLRDASLDANARRKGYWPLNAGLVLIAVSAFAFSRLSGG